MISPLTYQASQARIEELHRRSAEYADFQPEKKHRIRARFTALAAAIQPSRRRQRPDERVLAGAVVDQRLPV